MSKAKTDPLDPGVVNELVDGLMDELFEEVYTYVCPDCRHELDFGSAASTHCPGCGIKVRRPDPNLSVEHHNVINQLAPRREHAWWERRAINEGLTPARLAAEIKYTGREYTCGTRPISVAGKKPRRSKQQVEAVCQALYRLLRDNHPMTVRQVFYQLVSMGIIDKTEGEYKNAVDRLLVRMRRQGELPFNWLSDNTRWMRKPRTYSSLNEMLDTSAAAYRRAVWDNQDAYVEIWLEKDALAGVLAEETRPWDVPLMVVRGFSSLTFLHSAAETIAEVGKPTYLYYFGDYDPSGIDISRKVERDLRQFAREINPKSEIHFERVGVTLEQVETYNLPTRPTKTSDSRSKKFVGRSVEVDALPADVLRELARDCITQHIDERALEVLRAAEESERATLRRWVDSLKQTAEEEE